MDRRHAGDTPVPENPPASRSIPLPAGVYGKLLLLRHLGYRGRHRQPSRD